EGLALGVGEGDRHGFFWNAPAVAGKGAGFRWPGASWAGVVPGELAPRKPAAYAARLAPGNRSPAASLRLVLRLVLLLKKPKDLRHPPGDDVPMPGAGDFQVLVRQVQLFHPRHPPPCSLRPHHCVVITLHDDHGDVLDLVEAGWRAERG